MDTFIVSHRLRARYERNRPHSKTICGKPNEKNASSSTLLADVAPTEKKYVWQPETKKKGRKISEWASERAPYLIACAVVVLVFISTYLVLSPSSTPLQREKIQAASVLQVEREGFHIFSMTHHHYPNRMGEMTTTRSHSAPRVRLLREKREKSESEKGEKHIHTPLQNIKIPRVVLRVLPLSRWVCVWP